MGENVAMFGCRRSSGITAVIVVIVANLCSTDQDVRVNLLPQFLARFAFQSLSGQLFFRLTVLLPTHLT